MTEYRQCSHGFHHPKHVHSCDGCWCEGESDRRNYGWEHDTSPKLSDPNVVDAIYDDALKVAKAERRARR